MPDEPEPSRSGDSASETVSEVELLVAGWAERMARGELLDVAAVLAGIADPAARAEAARQLELLGLAHQALHNAAPGLPRRLGDFELRAEIGRGAMGVVYRAWQVSLDRPVAVKVITGLATLDARRVERFVREAQALGRLQHPGIVPVIAAGKQDGALYFAMELVDGVSLHAISAGLAAVPAAERSLDHVARLANPEGLAADASYVALVVRITAEVAEALHYAHQQGVLHRDVKPSNLMLTERGRVRLIDFGLARIVELDSSLTSLGVVGSPAYLPPEMLRDPGQDSTAQTDVYSLGVVLYELLAGRRPFVAVNTTALLVQVEHRQPTPLRHSFPDLPRDLETICATAMEKAPDRRYPTAAALAYDLRAFAAHKPIAARPPSPVRRAWLWLRRNPAAALGLVAMLGVFAVLAGVELAAGMRRRAAIHAATVAFDGAFARRDDAGVRAAIERLLAVDDEHAQLPRWRHAANGMRLDQALDAARGALSLLREQHRSLGVHADERDRGAVEMALKYMPADRYLAALRVAQDCERLDAERGDLLLRAVDLVEDARSAAIVVGQPEHAGVRLLRAELFLLEWRWAKRTGNADWARMCARRVRENDATGRFVAELDAPGRVTLKAPPGRDVFVFRYRPRHELSREDPSYRLVPVPFDVATRASVLEPEAGVLPGDPCVVVLATPPDPASVLAVDDLVIGVTGRSTVGGLWVKAVRPDSPAAAAGLRPWDRLVSANGVVIGCWADLRLAQVAADSVEFAFEGSVEIGLLVPSTKTFTTSSGVEVASLGELLGAVPPPQDLALTVVRGDRRRSVVMRAGVVAAAVAQPTLYPLWFTPRARLGTTPLPPVELPPDDYLLVVRSPGLPPLRVPFRLDAGESDTHIVADPPSAPPGVDAVWIPGGRLRPSIAGVAAADQEVSVAPYWIDRFEVTLGDWDRFQRDPDVAAAMERELVATGRVIYTPRNEVNQAPRVYRQDPRERFPVKSISHEDARAFVAWRNRELAAVGAAWYAALPSVAEWELAARGLTPRRLPWGDVFEPQLTEANLTTLPPVIQPVGSRLGDESPYGVRDLAGSTAEPTADRHRGIDDVYVIKGGSNQHEAAADFLIASEDARPGSFVVSFLGLRLVYRPR